MKLDEVNCSKIIGLIYKKYIDIISRSTLQDRADNYGYLHLHKSSLLECLNEGLEGIY